MTDDSLRLLVEVLMFVLGMLVVGTAGFYAIAQARQKAPATWQQMEDRYDRQQKRLDDALVRLDIATARIDQLEMYLDDLHDERVADRALLQLWIDYARKVTTRLKEITGETPPPEPEASKRPISRAALSRFLVQRFSVEEMDALAYEMGVASDELTGGTRSSRSRALVQWAHDHGLLEDLKQRAEAARPQHL